MCPRIGQINVTIDDKLYQLPYPEETEGLASLIHRGAVPALPYITVFFRPQAVKQLLSFIRWGEKTAENLREQVMLPYGYIGADGKDLEHPENGRLWSVVLGVVPVYTPQSTGTSVNIEAGEWQKAVKKMDRINIERREIGKNAIQPLGWIHTHPGWLDPFFSMTDLEYQPLYVGSMFRFGAVFNPHRQIWAVYAGPDSKPVNGFLQVDEELKRMYSFDAKSVNEIREKRPLQIFRRDARSQGLDDDGWTDWSGGRAGISGPAVFRRTAGLDAGREIQQHRPAREDAASSLSSGRTAGNVQTLVRRQAQGAWEPVPYNSAFTLDSLTKLRDIDRIMRMNTRMFILVRLMHHDQGFVFVPLAVFPMGAQWQIPRKAEDETAAALFINSRDLDDLTQAYYRGEVPANGENLILITEDMSVYVCPASGQ